MTTELLLRPSWCLLPDGRLVDGQVVLTGADGGIAYVGPEDGLPPGEREVVDAPGCTLLPGLIDLHLLFLHAHPVGSAVSPVHEVLSGRDLLESLLAQGITSIRDTATDEQVALDFRQLLASGTVRGPRLFAAGRPIGAGGRGGAVYGAHEVNGPVEARARARTQIRAGVDFLSVAVTNGLAGGGGKVNGPAGWQELRPDEIAAVVAEARAAGRPVSANALGNDGIRAAVEAGVDTVEHATELDRETADRMAEKGVAMVPTLTVMHCFAERASEFGLPLYLEERAKRVLERAYEAVGIALQAGVTIGAGTDSHGRETVIDEIRYLGDAGLSTVDAVRAATSVAADLLGPQANTGRVAEGYRADLLVVEGSLTAALDRPRWVVADGRLVVKETV
ncbi:amidohydrolase family protein [Amycolatopsis jejuensis]|uniref:amidohydrolase family protein n=1 Tax=Amycolatopsis jejuensis TaxID=330084 RepID=UPI0005267D1C|nr:amidohydrolase family protein [Amycolatopsis jejuensis]